MLYEMQSVFTLDKYLIMLDETLISVKQGGIKYHFFKNLYYDDQGLNPGLLANSVPPRPMGLYITMYVFTARVIDCT